ncbi:MAG: CDP-glycerol glycerophosphotransferase family protein [Lactobacillales bacterium]|nr:CDP-glycerol glycerophosphotransferase family protein [Lactobacillales bacterium]
MFIYKIYTLGLNFIYMFIKIFKTNNKKIFFLSRQSNEMSLDYRMLVNYINKNYPEYKIVVMTNMIGKKLKDKIKYIRIMIVQMYHLATSKTCVIDGYNITVSVLKHKKKLKIIQIWHSLGAIKKFGYQTLDKENGNSSKMAKVMKMHKNYDLIVTGSNAMIPYFSKAFNNPEEKFINCGLPRIDYLIKESENNKKMILKKYKELKNKKIILYVPTFRKGKNYYIENLINAVDNDKYELIIKGHPLKKIKNQKYSDDFTSLELLSIADYVITDYSAISIEAAVLNKPIYFYLYDLEEYNKSVGINIDLEKEMPKSTFKKAKTLIKNIENNKYSYKELEKFRSKYLDNLEGNATEKLAKYIVGEL